MTAQPDVPNHPSRPCDPDLHARVTWCGICGWPRTHMLPAVEKRGIIAGTRDESLVARFRRLSTPRRR